MACPLGDRAAQGTLDGDLASKLSGSTRWDATLTPAELAERERLLANVNALRVQLDTITQEERMIATERSALERTYSLPTHSDALAQAAALVEILEGNLPLCAGVGALFVLLFLTGLCPILLKLTTHGGYEEYLKSMVRRRLLRADPDLDQYHDALASSAGMKVRRLCDFRDMVVDKLTENFAHGENSELVRSIRAKIDSAVERCTDEWLQDVKEPVVSEEPSFRLRMPLLAGWRQGARRKFAGPQGVSSSY